MNPERGTKSLRAVRAKFMSAVPVQHPLVRSSCNPIQTRSHPPCRRFIRTHWVASPCPLQVPRQHLRLPNSTYMRTLRECSDRLDPYKQESPLRIHQMNLSK